MNKGRNCFGTVAKDNCIYATGGEFQHTIEIFDIRKNTWRYGHKLNFGTTQVNAVISDNRYIFTIGSKLGEEYLSVLVGTKWKSTICKKDFSIKEDFCIFCFDSIIYSLGGNKGLKTSDSIETLNVNSINNVPYESTISNFRLKRPIYNVAAVALP